MPRWKIKLGWGRPPVWAGAPAALTLEAGATFNWAPFASDADLTPLTFTLVSPPTGYSITSAGLMTAGPATGSVVVRASDVSRTADHTATVTIDTVEATLEWTIPDVPYVLTGLVVGQSDEVDLSDFYTKPAGVTEALTITQDATGLMSINGHGLVRPSTLGIGTYSVVVDLQSAALGQVVDITDSVDGSYISLFWPEVALATSYEVEVSLTGTSGWTQHGTSTDGSYTATNLNPGTEYFFRVRAINATQQGAYSATYPVTTGSGLPSGEQDWIARSTYTGVIWAHDFRSVEEVNYFLSNPLPVDPYSTTRETDGITGGTLTLNIPGNQKTPVARMEYLPGTIYGNNACRVTLNAAPTGTEAITLADRLRFFNLPSPWSLLNDTRNGGGGQVFIYQVFNIVSPTVYDVQLTADGVNGRGARDVSAFSPIDNPTNAVAQRCRVSSGSWHRPLSAFTGATNGIGVNDRGITHEGMPARTWVTTVQSPTTASKYNRYRMDFYGHPAYQTFLDNWPTWNGAAQTGMYRGQDCWIQFRVKISADRYDDSNIDANFANPLGLKMFGMWSTVKTPAHEVFFQDMNTPQGSSPGPETAADGGILEGYTNQGSAKPFNKRINNINQLQPHGEYGSTCYTSGSQSSYPTDLTA
jgi:hypothetical protein